MVTRMHNEPARQQQQQQGSGEHPAQGQMPGIRVNGRKIDRPQCFGEVKNVGQQGVGDTQVQGDGFQ